MKYILLVISFLFSSIAIAGNHSNDYKYPKKDCDKMYIAIAQLLEEADNHWINLDNMPVGSAEVDKGAEKIYWLTTIASNYTTVYKTFCDN